MGDYNALNQPLVSQFRVTKSDLCNLMDPDRIRNKESNRAIEELGGTQGLLDALNSSESSGILGSHLDRKRVFGKNKLHKRKSVDFFALVCECFEDTTLRILIAAALVSLVFGTLQDPSEGWMEGVAILLAVLIVVLVTSTNNYAKELQFRALSEEAADWPITVLRNSEETQESVFKLLVGDVMKVGAGDIVSADAVVLRSVALLLDESNMTGEPEHIKKGPESPFLISGTQVMEGTGTAVVIAVGDATFQGRNSQLLQQAKVEETPLQQKLNRVSQNISYLGFSAALLTFLVLVGYIVIDSVEEGAWGSSSWARLISAFIIAVTIVVVAVPEGLPLAVTLSLAFSVNKMKKLKNLVRHLDASETMGQATAICSDKTGTLTQNTMKVVSLYTQDTQHFRIEKGDLTGTTVELLVEAVCFNSVASISHTAGERRFTGNRTEIALLDLASSLGYHYTEIRDPELILAQLPFNSRLKRMCTVVSVKDQLHIHFKGASEVVLELCTSYIAPDGSQQELTEAKKDEILSEVIGKYAAEAQRTLTLAYKATALDFPHTVTGELNMRELEKDLVLLAIVGIEDPIREEVPRAVRICQRAGITVRMVTGDNKQTASAIARKCNIIPKDLNPDSATNVVLEGAEFRTRVQGPSGVLESFDLSEFRNTVKDLRVLARASPADKYLLVTGLQALGEVVAVTGDGCNDAPALKQAHVGFAMHIAGTQLAQEACDIVLLDDNFASIVTAVLWGRNIYECICKFIQFQLTVNAVALILSFVGACILKRSPLTAVQMLWVNLIMDTFAALALATEPPSGELLERPPVRAGDSLITADMMKNIVGQGCYQVIWLLVVLFLGPDLFTVDAAWGGAADATHFTLFFNTFVFLQVFNEVNCRKLKSSERNVFRGFCNNWLFLLILVVTVVVQVLIVTFGGEPLSVVPLSAVQHLWCALIGAGGLVFGFFVRLLPSALFKFCHLSESPLSAAAAERSSLSSIMRRRTTSTLRTSLRVFSNS